MSEAELIFTALAELSAAKARGGIARRARQQLEDHSGKSVVTGGNYLAPPAKKTSNTLGVSDAPKPLRKRS